MQVNRNPEAPARDAHPLRYLFALGFLAFLALEPLGLSFGREIAKLSLVSLAALDTLVPRKGPLVQPLPPSAGFGVFWLGFLVFLVFLWTPIPLLSMLAIISVASHLVVQKPER